MSQNSMRNFLIDQNFDQDQADFIVDYAFRGGMVDVLDLKDFFPKSSLYTIDRFWKELINIPSKRLEFFGRFCFCKNNKRTIIITPQRRLKMLIAWARDEFRIRESLGISMSWDGVAQVNIEELRFTGGFSRIATPPRAAAESLPSSASSDGGGARAGSVSEFCADIY
jgi:hypothetical protein